MRTRTQLTAGAVLLVILIVLLIVGSRFKPHPTPFGVGVVRPAASCQPADVQNAINSAGVGDTVTVPAGSCAWDWMGLPPDKHLTIQGAGTGQTIIAAVGSTSLYVAPGNVRVTGFTFTCGNAAVVIDGEDWRIDHNEFTCDWFNAGVEVTTQRLKANPRGLVDHNTFLNRRIMVFSYPASTMGELHGTTQWSDPLALGTAEAVYIEDNTITYTVFGNAVDCETAGRYVFRHNTVIDTYLEAHSIQGTNRACRKWEIYENTITKANYDVFRAMFIRGGTGVVFNNTVKGPFGERTIAIDNVRSIQTVQPPFGPCDGKSPYDGNQDATGWPCLDQIGRGGDSAPFNGTPPPYPPPQNSEPAYFWNNTIDGAPMGVSVDNGADKSIKANRDFFANVGAKPGYVPYVYPHPLQGSPTPPALKAPTDLKMK